VLYNRRGVTDYVLYDEAGILERTGVTPKNYPFLAALRGDPSDNLPGVPGVGEKTAAKLVNDWGDIDSLFSNLDHLTPKLRESLAANEERVRLNYSLTPIVCDVPLDLPPEGLGLEPDFPALEQLFAFLEMRTPKDRLFMILNRRTGVTPGAGPIVEDEPELKVEVLSEVSDAVDFLGRVETLVDPQSGERAAFVIEPDWSGVPGRSAIEGLGIVAVGGLAGYVDGALLAEPGVNASLSSLLGRVTDPLLRERVMGHRTKELMRVLLPSGIDFLGLAFDTAVVAYLVDPSAGMESLEAVAARRGLSLPGESVSTPQGQLDFSSDSPESGRRSAQSAARAQLILRLAERLGSELDAVEGRALCSTSTRPSSCAPCSTTSSA
jgi:DNA polymerase-1